MQQNTREIVDDICMSYGHKINEHIDFRRWTPEDEAIVKKYREFIDEQIFEQRYNH